MLYVYNVERIRNYYQTHLLYSLLCAFAKLRKVAIIFVMSVRPPVRKEQLGSH
jgi:hypothetical protein